MGPSHSAAGRHHGLQGDRWSPDSEYERETAPRHSKMRGYKEDHGSRRHKRRGRLCLDCDHKEEDERPQEIEIPGELMVLH